MVDTNDEWIRDRVGIADAADRRQRDGRRHGHRRRREGARRLRPHRRRHRPGRRGDLLLGRPLPQRRHAGSPRKLGITAPGAFDLNTACSGFSYALATVDHAIRAGAARNALVIGAEKLSDITDWTDRSTCIIFGDGAGAAVVTATADGEAPGIGPVVWGSAPEKSDAHHASRAGGRTSSRRARRSSAGPPPRSPRSRCRPASGPASHPSEIAAFVPHQANARIIDGIAKRLDLPNAVIAKDIVESGNTSAASVPLALSKLIERREVPSGAPVLLFGFGGGLTYAGQVVRCP